MSSGDQEWRQLVALLNAGRIDELLVKAKPLVKKNPKAGPLQGVFGTALARKGRLDDAEKYLRRSVRLAPRLAFSHLNLANVCFTRKSFEDAARHYETFLKLEPANKQAAFKLAEALLLSNNLPAARVKFEDIVSEDDQNASAWFLLGSVHRQMKEDDNALRCFHKTVEMEPEHAKALFNLGNIYRDLGQTETALNHFKDALSLRPDHLPTRLNIALCHIHLQEMTEALATLDEAIDLDPENPEPRYLQSTALFLSGHLKPGFQAAEWRHRLPDEYRKLYNGTEPVWDGEASLAGKRLIVHAEQGFGDTLMMLRFLSFLPSRDCHITVIVQRGLKSLIETNYPDFDVCEFLNNRTGGLPSRIAADFQCSLMSLAHLTRSQWDTPPTYERYLQADDSHVAKWKDRITCANRKVIGIVWRGNPTHRNDRNRSLDLETLLACLSPEHHYVVLQKDPSPEELALISDASTLSIQHAAIKTFDDTAGLCMALDYLFTVDTSVAHLGGALGVPSFVLIPTHPDWRWGLMGTDNIWYPSVRLIRQREFGRWEPCIRAAMTLVGAADVQSPSGK